MRRSSKAALATLDASGHPFATLVGVATAVDGTPLLLLSRLARHMRNLTADARASLLVEGADTDPDPLARGRVTIVGEARRSEAAATRRRFLARNPSAAMYAGFEDFAFYELVPVQFHLVAGFGRIHELPADEVLLSGGLVAAFAAAEADLAADLNARHASEIAALARKLGGTSDGWKIGSIDPDGCDLVAQETALRWLFPSTLAAPDEVRVALLGAAAA